MNRWWRQDPADAGEPYRGDSPPWYAAEDPPPEVDTVDLFFGWLNQRYGLHLARQTDYEPEGSRLWVLWGIEIAFVTPRPGELYRADLLKPWESVTGIDLSLTVVVTGSGNDAGEPGPTPRFLAGGNFLEGVQP